MTLRLGFKIYLLIITCYFLTVKTFAEDTNRVSILDPWPSEVASSKENWGEVIGAATLGENFGTNKLIASEVLAWSVKIDQLDCPPRLFEEAIVMIACRAPSGSNVWALVCLGRMPGGGSVAQLWKPFSYVPPLSNSITAFTPFDEKDIAAFIKATNFGYNEFYSDRTVLSVVLYRNSTTLEAVLARGVSNDDKRARYNAHIKSIPF